MPPYSSEFVFRVAQAWPIDQWGRFSILIAVSGGADSVAMLRAIHEIHQIAGASGELVVAHIDHGVRGAAGERDQEWVGQLAKSLGLTSAEWKLNDVLDASSHQGHGPESLMRAARYGELTKMAAEHGTRFLLTGHTADDQAETVLFRILRGTGPDGLAGIPRSRPLNDHVTIYRPLLEMTRKEVLNYLSEIEQDYREDESNVQSRYMRNRLRHEILPVLREHFGENVDDSIRKLSRLAAEQAAFIDEMAVPVLDRAFTIADRNITIDRSGAASSHPVVLKAALRMAWKQAGFPTRDMTADKWKWLAEQVRESSRSQITTLPGHVAVHRDQANLVLSRPGGIHE